MELTGNVSLYIRAYVTYIQEGGLWHPPLNRGEKDLINSDCTFREGLTLSVSVVKRIILKQRQYNNRVRRHIHLDCCV